MDVFTTNAFVGERARRTCNRDRSIQIESRRDLGALPDPRSFDPRTVRSGFVLRTMVQAVAVLLPVAVIWWAFA